MSVRFGAVGVNAILIYFWPPKFLLKLKTIYPMVLAVMRSHSWTNSYCVCVRLSYYYFMKSPHSSRDKHIFLGYDQIC
jgi:hypothetical protein